MNIIDPQVEECEKWLKAKDAKSKAHDAFISADRAASAAREEFNSKSRREAEAWERITAMRAAE